MELFGNARIEPLPAFQQLIDSIFRNPGSFNSLYFSTGFVPLYLKTFWDAAINPITRRPLVTYLNSDNFDTVEFKIFDEIFRKMSDKYVRTSEADFKNMIHIKWQIALGLPVSSETWIDRRFFYLSPKRDECFPLVPIALKALNSWLFSNGITEMNHVIYLNSLRFNNSQKGQLLESIFSCLIQAPFALNTTQELPIIYAFSLFQFDVVTRMLLKVERKVDLLLPVKNFDLNPCQLDFSQPAIYVPKSPRNPLFDLAVTTYQNEIFLIQITIGPINVHMRRDFSASAADKQRVIKYFCDQYQSFDIHFVYLALQKDVQNSCITDAVLSLLSRL